MKKPSPEELKKLIDGAQKYVKPSGYTSLAERKSLEALAEYEVWREREGAVDAPPSKTT
jgi:hypothetical protein